METLLVIMGGCTPLALTSASLSSEEVCLVEAEDLIPVADFIADLKSIADDLIVLRRLGVLLL